MSEYSIQAEDDYVQSANSLFHFMKEADYSGKPLSLGIALSRLIT